MNKKPFLIICLLCISFLNLNAQSSNQAINKSTKQSSTSSDGGSSNLAVDNDLNGNFNNGSVTKTNNETNAWWQVDLESIIDINLIKIYNRTDESTDRLSNFYVFISNTDLSERSFNDVLQDCNVDNIYVSGEAPAVLNIPKTVSARYIKIQLSDSNVLSLAEVQIYNETTIDSNCNDFCLIDDFDDYLNGSIRGQGNWEANPPGALDGAIISSDINESFVGKALMNDPNGVDFRGNAYKPLESNSISEGNKGTLFFQILGDDLANTYSHFGLSDLVSPRLTDGGTGEIQLYDDFEVQLSIEHGGFRVRNGTTNDHLINILPESGIVYNIWMVVDNQSDEFEVFVQGGIYNLPIKGETINGVSVFSFRNGSTESLKTLYLLNSPDNVESGITYFDHFYMDHNKENISFPIIMTEALDFVAVDTFETLQLGTINDQHEWVSNSESAIVTSESDSNPNQVMQIGAGSMNAHLSIPQIRNCDIGTIYYRIQRSGLVNQSIGLSDVSNPSEFADFENQINMQNTSDNLNARSGGSFLEIDNIAANQWYCVWMVTDNPADTYNIYLQGNGDAVPKKLSSGSLSDFSYRNGTDTNPLSTFFIKQNASASSFMIDDIYIDSQATNLSHPSSGQCNHGDVIVDNSSPLDDPISSTISTDGIGIVLEEFVTIPESSTSTPLTRINFLDHANDNSGRLFVNDLNNSLYLIENKQASVYLDVSAQFENFAEEPRLGSGFGFFAFHPEFSSNGKFYTVHTERFNALTNNVPDYTSAGTDDMHGIITEWTASNPAANVFSGTKRELLRIGFDTYLHGFQQIGFNRNAVSGNNDYGLLYLALGDGEENPVFSGAPQELSVPHGKVLCINPLGSNSANGKYGIPSTNPFVNTEDALGEIWAYGFRNPHRFSWDTGGTNKMFIANIGEKNIDAVYLGIAGSNYGWNEREGSFLFKKDDPNNVYALPSVDETNYSYPVAEYDHDEGFAIVGGFVYRGNDIPGLKGKYIFGDIVKGRVFYAEESEMNQGESFAQIKEFLIYNENGNQTSLLNLAGNSRADLRFGVDADDEIYLLSKQNGKIWKLNGATGLGIEDYSQKPYIKTFPNPVENILNINLDRIYNGNLKISILNLLGQETKKMNFNSSSNKISISVSDLAKGLYLLKLSSEEINYSTKFVKK